MTNYTLPPITNIAEILNILNQFTDYVFWDLMILVIWVISFISLSRDSGKGLTVSFFICLILSSFLAWLNLVHNFVFAICFAGFLFSLFIGGDKF